MFSPLQSFLYKFRADTYFLILECTIVKKRKCRADVPKTTHAHIHIRSHVLRKNVQKNLHFECSFIIVYDAVINTKNRVKTIQNKLNLKQLNKYTN